MRLRVGELLQQRGMTAYGLAKASQGSISLPTAYRLASGRVRTISTDVLESLCDILGVQPAEIFGPPMKRSKVRGREPHMAPRKGSREFMGVWWRPGNPDDRLTGTLVVSPDHRAELTLVGSFRELNELQHYFEHPALLGVAGNKEITLIHCPEVGHTIGMPGVVTTRYSPDLVLLGALVTETASLAFEEVYASYEHLGSWSQQSGYKQVYHHDENDQLTGFTLTYSRPPVQAVEVEGAQLRFVGGFRLGGAKWSEMKTQQTMRLHVRPNSPMSLEKIRSRYLHSLQNLIAFGVGHPITLLELHGMLAAPNGAPKHERQVEILFHRGRRGVLGNNALAPWDMLFTLADLAEDLESHIRSWLEKSELLEPVFNLYFGTMFNPGMYGEHRFLSLAQAAESHHRRTSRRQAIVDSKEFKNLRGRLCEAIDEAALPDTAADMFKSKLAFLNEIVLKERLRDLITAEGELASFLIGDTEAFVQTVAATRNYLTHFNKKSHARSVSGFDLHVITEQLRFLLECRLLTELGFSEDKKKALIQRSQRHRNERRLLMKSS